MSSPFWVPIYTETGFDPVLRELTGTLKSKFEKLVKDWWNDVEKLSKTSVVQYPELQNEKNKLLTRAENIKKRILSIPGYVPDVQLNGTPSIIIGGALASFVLAIMGLIYKWRLDYKKFRDVLDEFKYLEKKMPPNEAAAIMRQLKSDAYDTQLKYRNIAITAGIFGGIYLFSKYGKN